MNGPPSQCMQQMSGQQSYSYGAAPATSPPVELWEISASGTSAGPCNGEDWVELHHTGGGSSEFLNSYVLYNSAGPTSADALSFSTAAYTIMVPSGGFHVVCRCGQQNGDVCFNFDIDMSDTISLSKGGGADGVSSSGQLPGTDPGYDLTWARKDDGGWSSTSQPTPGSDNSFGNDGTGATGERVGCS